MLKPFISSLTPRSAALCILLLLALAPVASAQTTATLAGSVLDASGSSLPGVQVTVRQPSTGLIRSAVTGTPTASSMRVRLGLSVSY